MTTKKIIFQDDSVWEYNQLQDLKSEFEKRNIVICNDVYIKDNCRIENDVKIGNTSVILSNWIYCNTVIGNCVNIINCYISNPGYFEIGDNSIIEEGAYIDGVCRIGTKTVIGAKSILRDCVIGDNSKIKGCDIGENSIIGNNVTLGEYIKLPKNSKIEDDIIMTSIRFLGSNGPVTYWGTDEVHIDLGFNVSDNNYQIYTVEEFKGLFMPNSVIYKYIFSDFSSNRENAIPFDKEEMDEYKRFCDIIVIMDEKGAIKPINTHHQKYFKKKYRDEFIDEGNPDFFPVQSSKYQKYGGVNGFSDDTIDDAFEGDPDNTWNVD